MPKNNLFVPVGATADLKDFFEVEPEGALKASVVYSVPEGAPVTIDKNGILTATGNSLGNITLTLAAKNNPEISKSILVRTFDTPNNEEPENSINPDSKVYMFKGSFEEFTSLASAGGACSWNPVNNSISGLITNQALLYFQTPPVNSGVTAENGHLHFKYYLSNVDADKMDYVHAFVELTSNGLDHRERTWEGLVNLNPKVGWNEADLALKDASPNSAGDGDIDLSSVNFIRFKIPSAISDGAGAVQIKEIFLYEEDAPVQITIDGDMSDWAKVQGGSAGNHASFKIASDDEYIYCYSHRATTGRYSDIWGGTGYIYVAFDLDNNAETGAGTVWGNGPYEFVGYISPYGGSASEPAIVEAPGTDSETNNQPAPYNLKNVLCKGVVDENGAQVEFRIPRTDIPAIPSTAITVKAWGNKDLDKVELSCTL